MADREWYFAWLEDLRESGKINMFEAPGLMQRLFKLSRRDAIQIFQDWTKNRG